MGCQASNKDNSEESRFILTQELSLGFSQHNTSVLEANFYRLMAGGLLTPENVSILCENLHLDARVKAVSLRLSDQAGNCSGKKLLLYAISLSKGSEEDKAAALWNLYAAPGQSCIQPNELEELIWDLLSLALDLAQDISVFSQIYTSDRLHTYTTAQSHKRAKAVSGLKAAFSPNSLEVAKADFLLMVRTKTVEITSTRALRRVVEQTKAMPTRFSAAFKPAFSAALSSNAPQP